jgi:hypothetical protein
MTGAPDGRLRWVCPLQERADVLAMRNPFKSFPSSSKGAHRLALSVAAALAITGACAGDGPGSDPGTGGDASSDGTTGNHGGTNPFACVLCASAECPEVQACFDDPGCAAAVRCSMTHCLGASVDTNCLIKCFGDDPGAAALKFEALSCASTTCARECSQFLGDPP